MACGTTNCALKLSAVSTTALSFCTTTERPTSDDACRAWDEAMALVMELTDSFSEVMPSRLLNCANWATNSPLSCGSSGFWCCIWVTSNCRNASLPSESLPVLDAVSVVFFVLVPTPDAASTSLRFTPLVSIAMVWFPYH
ncbi:hypothetical protein D3C75_1119330 [compost metagenome]